LLVLLRVLRILPHVLLGGLRVRLRPLRLLLRLAPLRLGVLLWLYM
jgi:hypothetical protein